MPFVSQWVPAPKNMRIEVYEELPEGFVEQDKIGFSLCGYRTARNSKYDHAYFCRHCNGWIVGLPHDFQENTMVPEQLAGRRGTVTYCRRCGEEIAFVGCWS